MRQVVLEREWEVMRADLYFTQTSLAGRVYSTRLNMIPNGQEAILLGGRLRVLFFDVAEQSFSEAHSLFLIQPLTDNLTDRETIHP